MICCPRFPYKSLVGVFGGGRGIEDGYLVLCINRPFVGANTGLRCFVFFARAMPPTLFEKKKKCLAQICPIFERYHIVVRYDIVLILE